MLFLLTQRSCWTCRARTALFGMVKMFLLMPAKVLQKKNGTTKYWGDILDIKNHRNQRADISAMKNLILLPML